MNPYIELHGADRGETILVAVAAVQGVLPISALQVAQKAAPMGAKCQVFLTGAAFFVQEAYDKVKMLLDMATMQIAAPR